MTKQNHISLNLKLVVLAIPLALSGWGCTTLDPYTQEKKVSSSTKGAAIGAFAGAAIGYISGHDKDRRKRRKRALIGAGIGALGGGGVGHYMDRQEMELRHKLENSGVSVTRSGDNLLLNMPGNITFESDQSDINPSFYDVLNSVTLVLNKYDKTAIEITGHTDSTGSDNYNQQLSERRASSVASYLRGQGIKPLRVDSIGFGESRPVTGNDSPEGRQTNRRVELTLIPLTQG